MSALSMVLGRGLAIKPNASSSTEHPTAAAGGNQRHPQRARLWRQHPTAGFFGIREAGAMLVNLPVGMIRDGDRAWSAYQGG
jgi:hypothetical protein